MKKLLEWARSLPWAAALKAALKVLLPAALGAGGAILAGCMAPSDKAQRMSVYALGIPGVAVITSSTQTAANSGDDVNDSRQTQAKEDK